MSYDTKISSARKIIESHNENIDKELQVNFEGFLKSLQKEGGTSEDAIAQCSWEMLQKLGIPILIAKQIGKIFRGKSDGKSKSVYVSSRKASCMTAIELLERYNPKDIENAIGDRLKKISRNMCCIVFNDNGSINLDKSAEIIGDIQNDLPEIDKTLVEGSPKQVFKIGQRADNYADENPLYPGRALRSDLSCDQTGRSWAGVPLIVRQLLYIAVNETGELSINSIDDAHNALDKAMLGSSTESVVNSIDDAHNALNKAMLGSSAESVIRSRYQNASLSFDNLSKTGQLPILKIALTVNGLNAKKQDPFYSNKTY